MKTTLSLVVVACLAVIVIPKSTFAQKERSTLRLTTVLVTPSSLATEEKSFTVVNAISVNDRALKDFAKANKNATGVTWYQVEKGGGFLAHFSTNEVDTRVAYDKKGRWQYNLCTYMEDHLPFEIRDLVKKKYYDFSIIVCYAYEIDGGPVYIIKMEDSKSYKTLKVYDYEIVETDNYIKK